MSTSCTLRLCRARFLSVSEQGHYLLSRRCVCLVWHVPGCRSLQCPRCPRFLLLLQCPRCPALLACAPCAWLTTCACSCPASSCQPGANQKTPRPASYTYRQRIWSYRRRRFVEIQRKWRTRFRMHVPRREEAQWKQHLRTVLQDKRASSPTRVRHKRKSMMHARL